MGGYVQMDKDLDDDPRVLAITDRLVEHLRALGISEPIAEVLRPIMRSASLGSLYRLWRHGDTHLKRHDRLESASQHLVEVTGLPVTVLRKFPQQWLKEHEDGTVELPNYSTKNAMLNKDERREGGRRRTAKWRAKKRQERDASPPITSDNAVTSHNVTTGTGTGPGARDPSHLPGTGPPGEPDRETQAAPRGELASAVGRLARRDGQPKNGNGAAAAKAALKPTKTRKQLEHDMDHLADQGLGSDDIARVLAQYGVTTSQVTRHLANRQPDGKPS